MLIGACDGELRRESEGQQGGGAKQEEEEEEETGC
jgi:hypothetical protein